MKYSNYSTVIIGSGIAGLYAALKIQQGIKPDCGLLLITKSKLGESNSRYAQGGIAGVMKENKADSVQAHISDTIKAGAGLSEFNIVKFISEKSDAVVKDLLEFGVEFDRGKNGEFTYTLEAAHSVNRVLHAGGDATGRVIEQALCVAVRKNKNINVYEQSMAVELLVNSDNECCGVIVFDEVSQEYEVIYSSSVIIAAGGVGQLYKYTTNPAGATSDGIALAYRAGALLQDMEFVQFHPTALAPDSAVGAENRFLISEAVRGEGAKLVDADGIEFMHKYHPRKELAPRDVVTRAIFNEMLENKADNVYLSALCIDSARLAERFPNISQKCKEYGLDIARDFIPVAPAAHYFMGGIKTNINGETSVKGLFAIGEAASTGLHGGNRLASNSLLECIVCAYTVAKCINAQEAEPARQTDKKIQSVINKYLKETVLTAEVSLLREELREIMWDYVGILRSEKSLVAASEELAKIKKQFVRPDKCFNFEEYELRNMLATADLIINSALARKESRGAHFRLDCPETNDKCVHSIINGDNGEICIAK